MEKLSDLETRREEILSQMRSIRSMKRATINEQYLKVPHKGKKQPVLRGPYYVMSWREKGKTVGRRLTANSELEQAQKDIEAHKRFMDLCRQYVELTEKMGELERRQQEDSPEKKRRRSPSSRKKK